MQAKFYPGDHIYTGINMQSRKCLVLDERTDQWGNQELLITPIDGVGEVGCWELWRSANRCRARRHIYLTVDGAADLVAGQIWREAETEIRAFRFTSIARYQSRRIDARNLASAIADATRHICEHCGGDASTGNHEFAYSEYGETYYECQLDSEEVPF